MLNLDWVRDSDVSSPMCYICSSVLEVPYICCAECVGVQICPSCFSCGAEAAPHENNHSYMVVKYDFPLIEGSSWTAQEELDLLDAILKCGLGNWDDVSRQLKTHSAVECEKHYFENYVENPFHPDLPRFPESAVERSGMDQAPFNDLPSYCDNPPHYPSNSQNTQIMAGYNAAREDFEVEYDNSAEIDSCQMELVESEELQLGILARHNERLRERACRKKILRQHGLVTMHKAISWFRQYDSTVTRLVIERLLPFVKLVGHREFTFMLKGLDHARNLSLRLAHLQSHRETGITGLESGRVFQELDLHHNECMRDNRLSTSNPAYWCQSVSEIIGAVRSITAAPSTPDRQRCPAPPLDIVKLPGYESLTEAERQLCSTLRLVTDSYLEYRWLLTAESGHLGGLKLAQARALIQIDVNKMRKLYDFLLEQGYIQQPP